MPQRASTVNLLRSLSNILVLLVAAVTPGYGQDPPSGQRPITTLKIESKLVAVTAIARGESGQAISGLTRQDFLLKQDGKAQAIIYFSPSSDLPLTLALMVDTSGSQRDFIPDEIADSAGFFPALMTKPQDRAVLVQFDSEILELAELTNSVPTLEEALSKLSDKRGDLAGGTRLYDAISTVSHLELGDQLGRRAMVILTDGGDFGSETKIGAAIAEAQRADIMIYSVYYSRGGGNKGALERLSNATGGRVFTVGPTMSLKQVYAAINDDMRLAYELGYRPPESHPNKFHKIELSTIDKKLTIQARKGYFSK
jgi:Ca-activated chloride channel family protein